MDRERKLSIIAFSFFSSWMLSFSFEGQVLHAVAGKFQIDIQGMVFIAIAASFIGLLIGGFFIRTLKQAKVMMNYAIILCIISTIPFLFYPSIIWYITLATGSFSSGLCIAAWGFYFKFYTPPNERTKTAADVLIYSNLLMIAINMMAIHISPFLGLILSIAVLAFALYFHNKVSVEPVSEVYRGSSKDNNITDLIKPLIFLCFFIAIITINSGLMYQVINPAFEHQRFLVSWYWALPYIAAIYIMKNLPERISRNYILYVAIAMMGLSFIAFMALDRSAISYLIINTLMLGACGVYDLFWWSILGEMLDYHTNPAKILGIGLSANILGILIGCLTGNIIDAIGTVYGISILALIIVFITLMALPVLHKHLSLLLKSHIFLSNLHEMAPARQVQTIDNIIMLGKLTQRESEIVGLLLKGRTYKMIANELYLSENTVKTHIKNIYSKFQVQSKSELMELLMKRGHL